MRWFFPAILMPVVVVACVSLALANPAMVPNHPGHPMSDLKDPITGKSLANDPGQKNWTGKTALDKAAVSHDASSVQDLEGYKSLESQGAGVLPKTKGYPEYKIEPPVTEAINPNK